MATKKVNLKEFKSIIKNIIKEEMMKENEVKIDKDVVRQSAINKLKSVDKGNGHRFNIKDDSDASKLLNKKENKEIFDDVVEKLSKEKGNNNNSIGAKIAGKVYAKLLNKS